VDFRQRVGNRIPGKQVDGGKQLDHQVFQYCCIHAFSPRRTRSTEAATDVGANSNTANAAMFVP
jgi:hypothetical protein